MVNDTRVLVLNLTLLGAFQLIAACGGQDTSTASKPVAAISCLPGQTRACPCSDGIVGTQTCVFAAQQYDSCQCSQALSQAGAGGAAGSGQTAAPPAPA